MHCLVVLALILMQTGCENAEIKLPGERIEIHNHPNDVYGGATTQHIVYVSIGGGLHGGTTDIAPGESETFDVFWPTDYTVTVTYEDGSDEGWQDPPDQVDVPNNTTVTVTVKYEWKPPP
jgi:hypothetical protein